MEERKIFIMRHGERSDVIAKLTNKDYFDDHGNFTQTDLNIPRSLPRRSDGWKAYEKDTALTEIGYLSAKLTGRAFRDAGLVIDHVYCSPALRCVQTAVGFLKGMSNAKAVKIEPGLFEWTYFAHGTMPSFVPPEELRDRFHYNVDPNYSPYMTADRHDISEKLEEYYHRSFALMNYMRNLHPEGNILLVAHGASPDVCTRQLLGKPPRDVRSFYHVLLATSYLANIEIREKNGKLALSDASPVPPFTVAKNSPYRADILLKSDDAIDEEDAALGRIYPGNTGSPRLQLSERSKEALRKKLLME